MGRRGGGPHCILSTASGDISSDIRNDICTDPAGPRPARSAKIRGPSTAPQRARPRQCHDGRVKPRVLVVDDDSALAEMLGIVLRTDGFEPSFVADGSRAMQAFRESKPDIVLLDLMLPGVSGIDVCRSIRAESGTPIIMLTAKSDTVDVVLGLESGADDYVVKPFKPKELVARMRARLRHHENLASEQLKMRVPAADEVRMVAP